MKLAENIIKRPLLTEKGTAMGEDGNKVLFEVVRDANKIEIRKAVEKLFAVKVVDVRTMRLPKRWRRVGRNVGQRPGWKKAIVRLREGDKIEFFSGV